MKHCVNAPDSIAALEAIKSVMTRLMLESHGIGKHNTPMRQRAAHTQRNMLNKTPCTNDHKRGDYSTDFDFCDNSVREKEERIYIYHHSSLMHITNLIKKASTLRVKQLKDEGKAIIKRAVTQKSQRSKHFNS